MADLLSPKLLRDWGKAQQCIDFPPGEQLHRLGRGIRHEVDVAARVEPNIGRYAGEENMMWRPQRRDRNSLSLEIANAANLLGPEQLKTAELLALRT